MSNVVNKNINASKTLDGCVNNTSNIHWVGHVCTDTNNLATELEHRALGFNSFFQISDNELSPLFGKSLTKGSAIANRRTGYDSYTVS